jgi:hypothetical protein
MLEYRLVCVNKPENVSQPAVDRIETYIKYTDVNAAWQQALELNERSGAYFMAAAVH